MSLHWVCAQGLVDSSTEAGLQFITEFEQVWADTSAPRLRCQVKDYPARLSYDFHVWSGYELMVPVSEFPAGQEHHGVTAVKLQEQTPGTEPVYLVHDTPWPMVDYPPSILRTLEYNTGVGYLLGRGRYVAKMLVRDQQGRVCRKEWKTDVDYSDLELALPPRTVETIRLMEWAEPSRDAERRKATVLLQASPVYRRAFGTRLSSWDRAVLLGSLSSIAGRGRFSNLRVVAYDLQQRRVIFEKDVLDARGFRELGDKLEALDLGTVDYKVLTDGPSDWEFLTSMARIESERNTEALIFLGPAWKKGGKKGAITPELKHLTPRFYYLALSPVLFRPDDLVTQLVKSISGRIFHVSNPRKLAKSIPEIGGPE